VRLQTIGLNIQTIGLVFNPYENAIFLKTLIINPIDSDRFAFFIAPLSPVLKLKSKLKIFHNMNYQNIITIEPGKRGGKPCIRKMRITVYDVLGWLAAGMTHAEILDDFPELTEEDIKACLEFAADREHRLIAVVGIA
jgi:uncharacterized protein (DUF433 family)